MTAVGDQRTGMAAVLTAAGLTATVDPAALPPFVLIDAARYRAAEGIGGWTCDIPVRCVVPPPGDAFALAALEEMVEAVLAALGWAPAEPGTWTPHPNVDPIPAYTLTYTRSVPNPNC